MKHPFGNDKLPVREKSLGSIMFIPSLVMTNLGRFQGYQEKVREERRKAREIQKQMRDAIKNAPISFLKSLQGGLFAQLDLKMAIVSLPV